MVLLSLFTGNQIRFVKKLSELVIDSDSVPKEHNSESSGAEQTFAPHFVKKIAFNNRNVDQRLMRLYSFVRPRQINCNSSQYGLKQDIMNDMMMQNEADDELDAYVLQSKENDQEILESNRGNPEAF